MNLVMFDIDGTLVESNDFDSKCYQAAIQDVLNYNFVLVGSRIEYDRTIPDFTATNDVLACIGL